MTDFRIIQNLTEGTLRYASRAVQAGLVDDVAHVAVATEHGLTNPLYILSTGALNEGIFRPAIFSHVTPDTLKPSSALNDAVRALQNLGRRHGVDGISLGPDPSVLGSIKLTNSGLYEGGKDILEHLGKGDVDAGRAVAARLDEAARRVLEFVDAPH